MTEITFNHKGDFYEAQFISPGDPVIQMIRQAPGALTIYTCMPGLIPVPYYAPSALAQPKDLLLETNIASGMQVTIHSATEVTACKITESGTVVTPDIPVATEKSTGGVILGYEANGRNYPLQVSEDGRAFVNVPWTDTDTVYTLPQASASTLGGIRLGHDNKLLYEYPVQLDSEGRAFVSVPQREMAGLQRIEFEAYANDYAGIWCTSASDVTHMDFVMGDNIDAGNISDTFRWRFTSNNLLGTTGSPDKPGEENLHTVMELKPTGKLGGVLSIADAAGALQRVLTKADFAALPEAGTVTSDNMVDVVKQLLAIVKPATV